MSSQLKQNKINRTRRYCLQAAGAAATGWSLPASANSGKHYAVTPATVEAHQQQAWADAQVIIKRLGREWEFPLRDFVITEFGAKTCALMQLRSWVAHEVQAQVATPVPDAHDCYPAIAQAIQACHQAGGGRVVIPRGDWFCAGPMVLLSNVHVHLQAGAQIYFSNQADDYARYGNVDCGARGRLVISRWQSNDCLNYSAMVYAYGQSNIALTGEDWTSILNGQGGVPFSLSNEEGQSQDCWWTWKGKQRTLQSLGQGKSANFVAGMMSENTVNALNARSLAELRQDLSEVDRLRIQGEGERWRADGSYLPALSEAGVSLAQRVFGKGHFLRPPMIQLIGCDRVLLRGYQVTHTPFWQHHPVNCRDVLIQGVLAKSHGPNNDGFDPEACRYVLVDDCTFDTGDDCIAIKAGKNRDTQYGPSQDIVIQRCTMQSGHGAVTLGSEMAGGIQNVYVQECVFENKHWASDPLNTAIRLKTNLNRGGFLKNLYVRHIAIPNGVQTSPSFYASLPGSPIASKTVATAAGAVVTFDCDYAPVADNVRTRPPVVSNVHISHIKVGNVATKHGARSCYQAMVILGPVASDYNGPLPAPTVPAVSDVYISDCDFGTPVNQTQPLYLYNVKGLHLNRTLIAGVLHNEEVAA